MNNQEHRLELAKVVIAALVHDIGKFAQRAGDIKSKHMEGEYKYAHCLYTDAFIDPRPPERPRLPLPTQLGDSRSRGELARMAAAHHDPDEDYLAEVAIQVADWLSAGMDRRPDPEEEEKEDYLTARLRSVFGQICLEGQENLEPDQEWVYPLVELGSSREVFPGPPSKLSRAEASEDYKELYSQFLAAMGLFAEAIKGLSGDGALKFYIKGLITLLERYSWCVPSATYHTVPDISLFDHLLTTAAIAQALWVYHTTDDTNSMPGEDTEKEKFLLVKGDLSGIQDYILGIARSGGRRVAKLFRARSFYLQLVTRAAWVELLERVELFDVAKIMDAGGHFTLLLPYTKEVEKTLKDFATELEQWFYKEFLGQVSLNLGWVGMSEQDLVEKRFKHKYHELGGKLEQAKLRRFSRVLSSGVDMVFRHLHFHEDKGACELCRLRPAEEEETQEGQRQQPLLLCTHCYRLVNLGKKLPKPESQLLTIMRGDGGDVALPGGLSASLREAWDPNKPWIDIATLKARDCYAHMPVAGHIPEVTEEDIKRWQKMGVVEEKDGELFLDGEELHSGEVKTFGLIACEARELGEQGYRGKALLGVLKADVDNLGAIFSQGLGKAYSISRLAMLSRMMNHFFSEILVDMVEKEFPDIYMVYAGGDDLFVIGPWSSPGEDGGPRRGVIEFAAELERRFRDYTCHNPAITLSGGIAVVKPRLPVQAMARQAEAALEKAKGTDDKASLTLFGVTRSWRRARELLKKGQWLRGLVEDELLSTAQLMRLLDYSERCQRLHKDGTLRDALWRAHLAYDLARNVDGKDKWEKEGKEGDRSKLKEWLQHDENIKDIPLPVTYALYQLRRE